VKGGPARRLTNGVYDYVTPSWTLDGQFILATSGQVGDVDVVIRSDLVKIPIKDGDQEFLTDSEHGDFLPIISPDEKWIYFMSFQAKDLPRQRMILARVPFNGGKVQSLTGHLDFDPNYFELSPDGKRLYFHVSREGRDRVSMIPVDPFKKGVKETDIVVGDFMNRRI